MTSFLTDHAKQSVEKLIDGALKELRYICCFTSIVKEFEEEKVWLEAETTVVGQHIQVAKRIGEYVQTDASWEEEADKLIQEDTKTKQKCFFGLCPHCIWRYKRGKELTNKKDQIKKLMETGKELEIEVAAPLPDVEQYSPQDYISFRSRESKYNELLEALKDDNNYIIGLQGMGGTGKTTLAKEVGKILKESKQFMFIIDTTMSVSPNIKKIQDDIAGPLGLTFDDGTDSDRTKKLLERLTRGEKILLILDNVGGYIDFEEIGIPYSDNNHRGCKILATSREVDVCTKLGCSKTIRLELLPKDDVWKMFNRYAGLTVKSNKSLLDKGHIITNEIKRLPIAIAFIAGSLKGKQDQEERAEKCLKFLNEINKDDDDGGLVKCLKFSYDNLNDEKAKSLFLLCFAFRANEEIPTESLVRLGIGAGLFKEDNGSYEDARSQVITSKNKLLGSCLLLKVDHNRVRMHDLVHDAATVIDYEEFQTVTCRPRSRIILLLMEMMMSSFGMEGTQKNIKYLRTKENIKYLFCKGKLEDVFSSKVVNQKLQVLIVTTHSDGDCQNTKGPEILDEFFESIKGLLVFHLFSDSYRPTLPLPQSIQSLKNIRSLLFKCINLGDISILENLKSLERIDLEWCKIGELPKGLAELHKLRVFKLRSCEIEWKNPFEVFERCFSLEELYFTSSFNDCCREISFPMYRRFILDDELMFVNDSLPKCVSLLHQNEKHLFSEKQLKDCIQAVEVLRLRGIWREWVNIIPEIVRVDHGMNNLVELKLSCISQLKCLIDTTYGKSQVITAVFSNLVVLELEEMESLEELCNGPLSFDSLKSLAKLTVTKCNKLKNLFTCDIKLFNLKWLSLIQCPMLEGLYSRNV